MLKKIVISVFLLSLIACKGGEDVPAEPASTAPQALKPIDIKVMTIAAGEINDIYTLPGIVEPWEVVSISTELSGQVETVFKKEGDSVTAGENIIKVSTTSVDSTLRSARLQYQQALQDYRRTQALYKQGVTTQQVYEDARNHYQLMEVNYAQAKDNYNKGFTISTISGIIDEIMPKAGEFLPAGQPVARIVQTDKLKIYLNIPEKDVQYLQRDQQVLIQTDNSSLNDVSASIGYISTSSDMQTLTYRARVDTLPSQNVYPGKMVRVKLLRKSYQNAIIVPLYSVMDVDGEKVVFVESGGKAIRTVVQVENMIGSSVIISSGLNIGDRLVTTGQQFLSDGLPVRIVE
jgi:membrane fusion protein (multidrug efflux system)